MSLNLAENDPFSGKQAKRARKKRLQESSRLRQRNLHQELETLPLLKGTNIAIVEIVDHWYRRFQSEVVFQLVYSR
jgi:hypothetical protein